MDGMLTWLEVRCERWSSCLGKCWDSLTRRKRIIEIYVRRGFIKVGYLIERMMRMQSGTLAPVVFLPDDIMVDILPVRSLARWSCVDKSWKSLIRSRRSMDMYRGRDTEDRLRLLLSPYPPGLAIKCRDISKSLTHIGDENVVWLTPSSSPHCSSFFSYACFEFGIAGCCDGLLCFCNWYGEKMQCYIWNPTTGSLRWVSEDDVAAGDVRDETLPGFEKENFDFCYGFGYDSAADDYKIMRILWLWPGQWPDQETLTRVDVLSVGSNTLRRFPVRIRGVFWSKEAVFLHGSLHWLMVIYHYHHSRVSEYFILRFNLETEEMDEVAIQISDKTAPDCEVLINIVSDLTVVDGQLHVVVKYQKRPLGDYGYTCRGELEMRVMEEYGVETSWTKRLSLPYDAGLPVRCPPLYVSRDGGVLMENYAGHIVMCDPEKMTIQRISFPNYWKGKFPSTMMYVESFISPFHVPNRRSHLSTFLIGDQTHETTESTG